MSRTWRIAKITESCHCLNLESPFELPNKEQSKGWELTSFKCSLYSRYAIHAIILLTFFWVCSSLHSWIPISHEQWFSHDPSQVYHWLLSLSPVSKRRTSESMLKFRDIMQQGTSPQSVGKSIIWLVVVGKMIPPPRESCPNP
jgi:hypothetical protein